MPLASGYDVALSGITMDSAGILYLTEYGYRRHNWWDRTGIVYLYAINPTTRSLLWSTQISPVCHGLSLCTIQPAVAYDKVFLGGK